MSKNHDTATAEPSGVPNGTPEVEMITIAWNGQNWEVPASDANWDFAAIEALENGKGVAFLRAVLGRRQFARFELGNRRTARDAGELMDLVMARLGEQRSGE